MIEWEGRHAANMYIKWRKTDKQMNQKAKRTLFASLLLEVCKAYNLTELNYWDRIYLLLGIYMCSLDFRFSLSKVNAFIGITKLGVRHSIWFNFPCTCLTTVCAIFAGIASSELLNLRNEIWLNNDLRRR